MHLLNALGRIRTADLLARVTRPKLVQSGNRPVNLAEWRETRANTARTATTNGKHTANGDLSPRPAA
jgi:hypothetical protein